MSVHSPSEDLATVLDLIDIYRKPPGAILAKDSLRLLVRIVQLLEPDEFGAVGHALHDFSPEIQCIFTGMRSQFEALIGPVIGRLAPLVRSELEEHMRICRRRIDLLEGGGDSSTIFDQLGETGWKTHLSKEEWVQNSAEQAQAVHTERWHINKIACELQQLQILFDSFVSRPGTL